MPAAGATPPRRRCLGLAPVLALLSLASTQAFVLPGAPRSSRIGARSLGQQQQQQQQQQQPVLSRGSGMAATTGTNEVSTDFERKKEALKKTLRREYASFFAPMERECYSPNVQFIDPLTSLQGVDSYQKNVDMLGARTLMGKLLFSDAGIVLHNIEDLGPKRLLTRWTLRIKAKLLPWAPMARFTGVSIYDLDDEARVVKQTDYWDSINLKNGEYAPVPLLEGVKDFLGQIGPGGAKAQQAMNAELPFELLRRSREYEVRRYPAFEAVETNYENRPEGYDRLGTYASGWNVENRKIRPFSPSIMRIAKSEQEKLMLWPVGFSNADLALAGGAATAAEIPTPADGIIRRSSIPSQVVAVLRFDNPATAPVVKYFAGRLLELLKADGLVPTPESEKEYQVAQFDAIFSVGTRRNEVWAVLKEHPWKE